MQRFIALPHIKTSLAAAAVTVSAFVMLSGSASATEMHQTQKNGNANHGQMQHDDHGNKHNENRHNGNHVDKASHENNGNHGNNNGNHSDEQSQAAIDLRVGLNNLLREHVSTNIAVNRSIALGASHEEIAAGMEYQLMNSDSIAAAVGSVYGAEAEAQFSEMFREHIVESNNYAMAVAAGDEAAKELANAELQEYLVEIATFFSTAIPVLPYEAVYALLSEHENLINQSTEAFKYGDYSGSYHLEAQALTQVSGIADALASGIVATQPDKF